MMENETNLSCNITHFSREQKIHFQNYFWWVETMGNLCGGCIGVFLNLITIHVFSSPALRKNFFNRLLICLAVFDTLYISCEISEVFRHRHNTLLQQSIFVNFVYPIRNIFMFSSVYMTVVLAFERYQAITNPMEVRVRGVKSSMNQELLTHVFPGVVFAMIYYIPKFFELDVEEIREDCNNFDDVTSVSVNDTAAETMHLAAKVTCTSKYILVPTNLRRNPIYVFWYFIVSNLTLTAVLPFLALTVLNLKIVFSLRQFADKKQSLKTRNSLTNTDTRCSIKCKTTCCPTTDVKKTFILFSIVALFAICHSLRVAFNIDEFIYRMSQITNNQSCRSPRIWAQYVGPFNQLLIILNSSLNFFIYTLFDIEFQHILRKRLGLNIEKQNKMNTNTEGTRLTRNTKIIVKDQIELSNLNIIKV